MFLVKIASSQGGMGKKGSEKAPDEIVEALNSIYLTESGFKHNFVVDSVEVVENNIEETNKRIFEKAGELLDKKTIFLGGDHSVTYPVFKAFAKRYKEPGIVVFDAHPDCVNSFHPPSHEDWLRTLVEDGILKPENIVIVALRNIDEVEREFLQKNKIKVFTAKQLAGNVENCCDAVMEIANSFNALYVSVDIDAADPAFAPGTGYIEPAGLTGREIVYFVQRLKKLKNFRAADIVEVNPDKDINNMTSKLAARLVAEMW